MRDWRSWLVVVLATCARTVAAAEWSDDPRVGPFAKDEYPQAVIDRPLTLPAGMVEGELGATFRSYKFPVPNLDVTGFDEWTGDVTLRVGVTDRIQVDVGTAFSLDYVEHGTAFQGVSLVDLRPSLTSWKRVVPLTLSFLALDTEPVDTALTLTLPFTASAERTIFFGRGGQETLRNGNGRVLPEVDLGAPTRWRLCDWFWLRAGQNLFAVTTGDATAGFFFNVGVGVQAHRTFAVTLDTRLAFVAFDGNGEVAHQTLADQGVIALEGTYSPTRWFDLVGGLTMPDVGRGFDDYATRVAIRARF